MKQLRYIALLCCFSLQTKAQELQWNSFNELSELQIQQERPMLVFIHTQWCLYCKMQEEIGFKDPKLQSLINTHFYALPLDAEDKKSIEFLGRTYEFNTSLKHHQLALTLTKGSAGLLFPTLVIMDEHFNIKQILNSYQDPKKLYELLKEFIPK